MNRTLCVLSLMLFIAELELGAALGLSPPTLHRALTSIVSAGRHINENRNHTTRSVTGRASIASALRRKCLNVIISATPFVGQRPASVC